MTCCGYARVSSTGQSLEVQVELLKAEGCSKIFQETRSGASTDGRAALADALDWVREGDTFVVTRLDRLARSIIDLRRIVDRLEGKGVKLRVLQQGAIDTSRSDGRLMLNILAAFAEFELDIRRERQADGIAKARAAGVYKGRPTTIDTTKIRTLRAQGMGPAAIARALGIGRASVYRHLGGADNTA